MTKTHTLIIGANSEIAQALSNQLVLNSNHKLTLVSTHSQTNQAISAERVWLDNYSESAISDAAQQLKAISLRLGTFTQVFICMGILHDDETFPEKKLEEFNALSFSKLMHANAMAPILWIKELVTLLPSKVHCKITVFSARVGSISDNKLGGWYSYRASKSALNMLLKTAAIELARRAKNIKLIAFHPGTTDTPLSKPFQKNVSPNKLFTPEFVAKQLLTIVEKTEIDGLLSYLDWQGKTIEW